MPFSSHLLLYLINFPDYKNFRNFAPDIISRGALRLKFLRENALTPGDTESEAIQMTIILRNKISLMAAFVVR